MLLWEVWKTQIQVDWQVSVSSFQIMILQNPPGPLDFPKPIAFPQAHWIPPGPLDSPRPIESPGPLDSPGLYNYIVRYSGHITTPRFCDQYETKLRYYCVV